MKNLRIEIRSDSVVLDGYVNATGKISRILPSIKGKFVEEIVPKTFQKALLKAQDIDLLFNHDKSRKLGSWKGGQMELREDPIGLRCIATVTDQEVCDKARQGALKGWSFGFVSNSDTWTDYQEGIQKRMITDMDLIEISILDKTPAYIATTIESRESGSLVESREEDFVADVHEIAEQENPKSEIRAEYHEFENELMNLTLKGIKHK